MGRGFELVYGLAGMPFLWVTRMQVENPTILPYDEATFPCAQDLILGDSIAVRFG